METRHAIHPEHAKTMGTEELRKHFHVANLMNEGNIKMVYSHVDRTVVIGAVPTNVALKLDDDGHFRTDFFLQRREVCFINVGQGKGLISVDGEDTELDFKEGLYIGRGHQDVQLKSQDDNKPARFYGFSCLAHTEYPTKKVTLETANPAHLGSIEHNNERTIYKMVDGTYADSCQLMMGMTLLGQYSNWNTMPAHTHDRRCEVYFYFNMEDEDKKVFHFMGEPTETRHIVVGNEEAVISPSWSIHAGAGTGDYAFIWAMAGENYNFTDMDFVDMKEIR